MEHHYYGPMSSPIIGSNNLINIYNNGQSYNGPFLSPPQEEQNFIGRKKLLGEIKQYLFSSITQPLIVIEGLPGIGKTALASALAYDRDLHTYFLQGIFWASVGKNAHSSRHLQRWMEVLGIASKSSDGAMSDEKKLEHIQDKIGMGHALFILDDVWNIEDVQSLRIGGPNCAYIITTRAQEVTAQLTSDYTLTLSELDTEESSELLATFFSIDEQLKPVETQQLLQVVRGHPLSLVLCGTILKLNARGDPERITELLSLLKKKEKRLSLELKRKGLSKHPSLPSGLSITLPAIIALSDDALSNQGKRALRLLTNFAAKPNSFAKAAAIQITGVSGDALFELVSANLLQRSNYVSGVLPILHPLAESFFVRYTMHQVISDYASTFVQCQEWFPGENIQRQHASYYETLLRKADNLALEHPAELPHALLLFDIEWSNIFQGWEWSKEHMKGDEDVRMLYLQYIEAGMGRLLNLRLSPQERIQKLNEGLQVALLSSHRSMRIVLLHNLGHAYNDMGQIQQALFYYQMCLEQLVPKEMRLEALEGELALDVCQLYDKIADVYNNMGEVAEAINIIGKSQKLLAQEKGLFATSFDLLTNLGNAFHILGFIDQAINYYTAGLDLLEEDQEKIVVTNVNLSLMFDLQGNSEQARVYAQQALNDAHEMHIAHLEGNARLQLASIFSTGGKIYDALQYAQQGKKFAEDIGNHIMEVDAYEQMGLVYYRLGDFNKAETELKQGLNVAEQYQYKYYMGTLTDKLAMVKKASGKYEEAIVLWQNGRKQLEALDAGGALSLLLTRLINIYSELRQIEKVEEIFQFLSHYVDRQLSLRIQMALLHCHANFYQAQKKDNDALRLYEQALQQTKNLQDIWEEAGVHFELARLLQHNGKQVSAEQEAKQALALYQELQVSFWGERVQEWLDTNM